MQETAPPVSRYRFGPFLLDPGEGTLARNGNTVKLQDLPYRLLLMLVERPGEIITREEVRQRLWPENTFVEFDNSLGVAIRKVRESLNDNAEAPNYVATIPRRGYRFVAPVTLQRPEKPAENGDVSSPARPQVAGSSAPARVHAILQPHWSYWLIAGAALILGVMFRVLPVSFPPSVRLQERRQRRDRTGESASLGGCFWGSAICPDDRRMTGSPRCSREMLDTELGTPGDLRMVSQEDVARARRELPPIEGDTLARTTLERMRKNPGADLVVLGSIHPCPAKTRSVFGWMSGSRTLQAEIPSPKKPSLGHRDNLFELAARAGSRLRQRMGLSPNSLIEASAARVALPSNERSARLYVDGRAKLWAFDFQSARDLLLDAVAADDKFPLAHSALSEAWWHLGYLGKAKAEAQRARALSQDLSQEDRLLIEGQYWRSLSDLSKTVATYRTLFRLYPDSLDYGLLLATAQINIQPAAALQTLATLRTLPAPLGDDARIDMTEASAWIGQDFTKARAAARAAIAKGQAQGRPVLVARTYGFLCQQGGGTGDSVQQAVSDCESARQSAVADGDRNGEAMMLTDLASLRYQQGQVARSEEMFLTAIKQFREVGNQDGIGTAMSDLGATRLAQGDLAEARKLIEGALPSYEATEDKEGIALALNNLADLSRQNGKLRIAETEYQRAKATAQEIDNKSAVAYTLVGLGDVSTDRGDLATARSLYEQSLSLRNQIGEKQLAGETLVAMAHLSIEQGRSAEIEKSTRALKAQFHEEGQADDELAASIALVQALLAQARQRDAETETQQSQTLAAKSQNLAVSLQYDLVAARVLIASDHPEEGYPCTRQGI